MLIPIGHERTTVRRWPWVSFAIIALCCLIHLMGVMSSKEQAAREAFDEAVEYWVENADLELPKEFGDLIRGIASQAELEIIQQAAQPQADRRGRQATLDELAAATMESFDQLPSQRWGYTPSSPSFITLISSQFLHADIWHLLGNMFFFFLAGPVIEDRWGRPFFVFFYLACGSVAALAFASSVGDSSVPLIGASGAIAGLMGAFLVRFAKIKIRFFYFFFPFFRGTFEAPAWLMLPLWFLREILFANVYGESSSVAFMAHVGGFAFGAALTFGVVFFRVEQRFFDPVITAKTELNLNHGIEEAWAAFDDGRRPEALEIVRRELGSNPTNDEAIVCLRTLSLEMDRPDLVNDDLRRFIEREVRTDRSRAADRFAEHADWMPEPGFSPRVAAALLLALDEHQLVARAALLRNLEPFRDQLDASMLARIEQLGGVDATQSMLRDPQQPIELASRRSLPRRVRPTGWNGTILSMRTSNGERLELPIAKLQAVAAGMVRENESAELVIELITSDGRWRFSNRDFDPRKLFGGSDSPGATLVRWLSTLIDDTTVRPIPDRQHLIGRPWWSFETLADLDASLNAEIDKL